MNIERMYFSFPSIYLKDNHNSNSNSNFLLNIQLPQFFKLYFPLTKLVEKIGFCCLVNW